MIFDKKTLEAVTRGAAYLTEEDGWFGFHRYTAAQEAHGREVRGEGYYKQMLSGAGIRLAFYTDAPALTFRWRMLPNGNSRPFGWGDIRANDVLIGHFGGREESMEGDASVTLPGGRCLVEIYLPYTKHAFLSDITLAGEVTPYHREKVMISYGDSITHGYDAQYPSLAYAPLLAKLCGADSYNKAIGGDVFDARMLEPDEPVKPDIVTAAFDTNDWGHKSRERLLADATAYLQALSAKFPAAKIFALSPIWRADHARVTAFGAPTWAVDGVIHEAAAGLSNVHVINCWHFIGQDAGMFGDGSLHPNDLGFADYARGVYAAMLPYIV
ncbi:MAG: SGNH/GDSL hydrolase family protein [Clostridia bacterium]|nr:SGNH/GDSL hydrolase family protein [Clostridia bacterium]